MDAKPKFKTTDLTAMTHMKRTFVIYQIEESELDRLASGYTSIHFGLFGMAFGTLLLAITTLKTVTTLSEHIYTLYFCLFVVSLVFSIYFGFMARRDCRRGKSTCLQIKSQSKPMG